MNMYEILIGRNESDKARFGTAGTILLGKHYIMMGQEKSLANPILLDVARPHVILVSGKRGSGKCLHGDTLITLEDGTLLPIKELENDARKVLCLNDSLKIQGADKVEFFKRNVNKLIKLKLRSGKEIKLTPEHPLLTIFGWKSVHELGIGSRIATPRLQSTKSASNLEDYKIKLLAYLLAEGHLSNNFVLFSNSDPEINQDFFKCVDEFDNFLKIEQHSKPFCYRISQKSVKHIVNNIRRNKKGQILSAEHKISKNSLRDWLTELGVYGKLSKEKYIPPFVFKLNNNKLAIFLNRLFSCDGSIYKHAAWEISYASSSEKLIRQVQHLLSRFEILSRLRAKKTRCNEKEFDTFELEICGENLLKFIKAIGFFGKKVKKQEIALQEVSSTKRNPNVDTIPKDIWELYRPKCWADVGRALGYSTFPKAARESQFYSPSREKLLQIAIADNALGIKLLAESDIFWDEIMVMELLDGEFEVYDIAVPEFHNFVANDIFVHNSYTLGVIAEGMANLPHEVAQNLTCLIFDTMGIYWTMKYPNYRDDELLSQWELEPKVMHPKIFVPLGLFANYKEKGIPVDAAFSIRPADVEPEEWCRLFGVEPLSQEGILIDRAVLAALKLSSNPTLEKVKDCIEADKDATREEKNIVLNRFEAVERWGIFSEKAKPFETLIAGGQTIVLDLSAYGQMPNGELIKALVIGFVAKKALDVRLLARKAEEVKLIKEGGFILKEATAVAGKEAPLLWMMIDEAHEFLPKVGKTLATTPLIQLLREGRQPGISLVLATQQPGKIHTDVLTQSDIVISHRLTAKLDVTALNEIMQTYLTTDIQKQLDLLPQVKGAAIVLDDASEKIYPMAVRPRMSWHGGGDPSAIRGEIKQSFS